MSQTNTQAETKSVVMERVMAHPPEKVWRALTQTAMLAEWLMANDFQPIVGHKCQFHWSRGEYKGDVTVEVKLVDAPNKLAYTWGDGSPAQGTLLTLVTWTLEPTGAGTRLRMEQTGFTEAQEQARRGAEFGWNGFMPKLEAILAK
jgi:uncharacterized protein YndB with AHSA1/START domain